MTVLERVRGAAAVVPASRRTVPWWAVLLAVPVVAAIILAGVWVTGAELTEDATTAMVLTGAWFALAGGLALLAGLRWRRLALAVVGTWLVTSLATGSFLLWTSTADRVVDEDVVAVAPTAGPDPSPSAADGTQQQAPTLLASGRFRSGAHETAGRASLIDLQDGQRVLTLTGFRTDPGPDLRVYLVPGDGSSTDGAVDLGRLRGNKGDQQYDVPSGAPAGGVVVWCRAFSVAFGHASLSS